LIQQKRYCKLFLSHSAVDIDLAEYLELEARRSIPSIDVFRTTRVGQIQAGSEWFNIIAEQLRQADCFLILLTEASINRPWICFETGAAWFSKRPIVPVLSGEFKAEMVPEPLRSLQLLSLGSSEQASQVFRELGGELRDPDEFVTRVRELALRGKLKALDELGWEGIQFEDQFYAYEGPFQHLSTGDAIPMPEGLPRAFQQHGFENRLCIPGRPKDALAAGYKCVWLIDKFKQKRPLLSRNEKQQLYVRHLSDD
jgi:hypothetical protein